MSYAFRVGVAAWVIALLLVCLSRTASSLEAIACKLGQDEKFSSEREYAIYALHQESERHRFFDKNCDGVMDQAENAAYDGWLWTEKIEPKLRDYQRQARAGPVKVPDPKTEGAKVKTKPDGWSTGVILRDSFADIAVFTKPKSVRAAGGANFGWTRDGVADNDVWSAKGVAGYTIVWQNFDPLERARPYLAGFALAPIVSFNRVANSSPAQQKKDINVLTLGGSAEIALANLLDDTTLHFLRARAALIGDFDGNEKSWSATFEYLPVTNFADPLMPNIGSPNGFPGLPATYQIDAILRAQYAQRLGAVPDPLFAVGDEVFRTGPVLSLSILPQQGPDSPVPEVLQRFSLTASYSLLYDAEFAKSYTHFTAALGFALDKEGHWGIKLSYERGKVEETAAPIDVTKLGLAAKF